MATVYSAELTEDRRDALQEMVNVAMGRAGSLMADHMRCFIHLSIPVISIVSTVKLSESLSPVADGMAIPDPVTGVRQGFYDSEDLSTGLWIKSRAPSSMTRRRASG